MNERFTYIKPRIAFAKDSVEEVRKLRGRKKETEKRFMIEKSSIVEDGFFICDNTGKFSFPTTKDKSKLIMYAKQLNELNNENEQLKSYTGEMEDYLARLEEENEQLKERNDRQCNQLKQLWELIEDEDYNTLRSMLNQRETDEKLLQKEWGTYSD